MAVQETNARSILSSACRALAAEKEALAALAALAAQQRRQALGLAAERRRLGDARLAGLAQTLGLCCQDQQQQAGLAEEQAGLEARQQQQQPQQGLGTLSEWEEEDAAEGCEEEAGEEAGDGVDVPDTGYRHLVLDDLDASIARWQAAEGAVPTAESCVALPAEGAGSEWAPLALAKLGGAGRGGVCGPLAAGAQLSAVGGGLAPAPAPGKTRSRLSWPAKIFSLGAKGRA